MTTFSICAVGTAPGQGLERQGLELLESARASRRLLDGPALDPPAAQQWRVGSASVEKDQ